MGLYPVLQGNARGCLPKLEEKLDFYAARCAIPGAGPRDMKRGAMGRSTFIGMDFLSRVIVIANEARAAGDHPFGALLVVGDQIVIEAHNLVHTNHDITAHAEMMLVRKLERAGRLALIGAGTVYASCEPCPMCVGAMFWAGCRRVVYGLSKDHLAVLACSPGEAIRWRSPYNAPPQRLPAETSTAL